MLLVQRRRVVPGALSLALLLVTACGSKKGGGSEADCKPLTATIDGQPVTGLTHGLGFSMSGDHAVYVFNHDKVTCEEMMAPSRTTAPDEVYISGGLTPLGPAVAYNSTAQIGPPVEVELVTKPSKPGERVAMCIKAQVPFNSGPHAGKTLTVEGLLAGTYCGDRK